ncbi:MAG TPA: UDP-glucose/GDP-mannose dehydrogenase family protein [Dehalococcoidia bacterium]|nr:UDP-glucose/GDP-mannose dehydrogenase family protein [Dehalococcoidia bacterium]
MADISIIGAGYVGLVTGACLAELGHNVVCIEINPARLSMLQRGILPIREAGLDELVARHRSTGRLSFTNDFARPIPASQFVFLAVNTPPEPSGRANTSFVFSAVRSVLEHARPSLTIITKSTVPVGTGDEIARMVGQQGIRGVQVVSNPEFLQEGKAVKDFLQPDRIVVGAETLEAGKGVAQLYQGIHAPIIQCSRRSAELAKYAANAFLATRVSFMNEMSSVCQAAEADIEEVARILGADRRIGSSYLKAGLGWGGSCLPKDVRALASTFDHYGCESSILKAVFAVNLGQRKQAFDQLRQAVDGVPSATVGVLGLAFKPETDDVREAPALDIITRLLEDGIQVRAHDPIAAPNARLLLPGVHYCEDAYGVADGSHALLLATEWPEYLALDWREVRSLMRGRVVLDGRNVLDGRLLTTLGFTYLSFGRLASQKANGHRMRPALVVDDASD